MNPPDYRNYSIRELLEARQGVDQALYPERAEAIEKELSYRQSAGYAISVSSPADRFFAKHIPFYEVALPIWWQCAWRFLVVNVLALLVIYLPFSMLIDLLSLPKSVLLILVVIINLVIPVYAGSFIIRQALAAKYKHFNIEITRKNSPEEVL